MDPVSHESRRSVTVEPVWPYYPEEETPPWPSAAYAAQFASLVQALQIYFRDRADVWVGGHDCVFYHEHTPTRWLMPDLIVLFGLRDRPGDELSCFCVRGDGEIPAAAIEFAGPFLTDGDRALHQGDYATLGVREYYAFDVAGGIIEGYYLADGHYVRWPGEAFDSPTLGLRVVVQEGRLRLAAPGRGALLRTYDEYAALAEEQSRVLAAQEAEIARLRAELARLRASTGGDS